MIASARKGLPDRLFRQYFLAEFVDDGEVFVGYKLCVEGLLYSFPDQRQHLWVHHEAKQYDVCIGADWAKRDDYTVFTAWCKDRLTGKRRMIGYMRFHGVNYVRAVNELRLFAMHFRSVSIVEHDRTGVGDAIDDMLASTGLPYIGRVFSNSTKGAWVSKLVVGFQNRDVIIPFLEPMIEELDAYEVAVTPSGNFTYEAAGGSHDDIVSSMLLGYNAVECFYGGEVLTADGDKPLPTEPQSPLEAWYSEQDDD
jgi:phage FluMu gp28-like protein